MDIKYYTQPNLFEKKKVFILIGNPFCNRNENDSKTLIKTFMNLLKTIATRQYNGLQKKWWGFFH